MGVTLSAYVENPARATLPHVGRRPRAGRPAARIERST
jgi:hypothetical protein